MSVRATTSFLFLVMFTLGLLMVGCDQQIAVNSHAAMRVVNATSGSLSRVVAICWLKGYNVSINFAR